MTILQEHRLKKHYSKFLLFFILSYLFLEPLDKGYPVLYSLISLQYVLLLIFGPYIITGNRLVLSFSVVISIAMMILTIMADKHEAPHYTYALNLLGIALTVIITGFLFWHTAHRPDVSKDVILTSICIYLLIAICFSNIYLLLEAMYPNSFSFTSNIPSSIGGYKKDFTYFSFVTLTTLGYGDIVPVSPFAKRICSLESALGILYIAIFIGRLIGQHLHHLNTSKQ